MLSKALIGQAPHVLEKVRDFKMHCFASIRKDTAPIVTAWTGVGLDISTPQE